MSKNEKPKKVLKIGVFFSFDHNSHNYFFCKKNIAFVVAYRGIEELITALLNFPTEVNLLEGAFCALTNLCYNNNTNKVRNKLKKFIFFEVKKCKTSRNLHFLYLFIFRKKL